MPAEYAGGHRSGEAPAASTPSEDAGRVLPPRKIDLRLTLNTSPLLSYIGLGASGDVGLRRIGPGTLAVGGGIEHAFCGSVCWTYSGATPMDFGQRQVWPQARVTYHDSCSSLRELGVRDQPRQLLAGVAGLELAELEDAEVCCGFGGTFCVKYPQISTKMVDDKVAAIEATGAELVLAGDLGCLMNIAGRLKRLGSKVEARHVAEVLAGAPFAPPIGGAGV